MSNITNETQTLKVNHRTHCDKFHNASGALVTDFTINILKTLDSYKFP